MSVPTPIPDVQVSPMVTKFIRGGCRALAATLVALGLIGLNGATAQQPATFNIALSASSLNQPAGAGGTIGQGLGTISAFADGELCVTVDVTAATSDPVLQLGLPGQPESCSRQWAIVSFQDGQGRWLNTWYTLQPGNTVPFDNFAPQPPCEPGPCPTPGPNEPFPTATSIPETALSPTATPTLSATSAPIATPEPTVTPEPATATPDATATSTAANSIAVTETTIQPPSVGDAGLLP